MRPRSWAEAPEASLGRSGCARGRAGPGEEAPWGRLKGAERGSGRRAEGARAVCTPADGARTSPGCGVLPRDRRPSESCREAGKAHSQGPEGCAAAGGRSEGSSRLP